MVFLNRKNTIFIVFLLSFLFFFFADYRVFILTLTWIFIVSSAIQRGLDRTIPLFAFMIALFAFLMSGFVFPELYETSYMKSSLLHRMHFNQSTISFIHISVYIAIVFSFLGFYCTEKKQNRILRFNPNSSYYERLREIAKRFFYITTVFAVLVILEKAYYVWSYGYMDMYLSFRGNYPTIFYKLNSINTLVFYIYLATLPDKKSAKPVILIYFSLGILSLLIGARTTFILTSMFLMIYGFLRNYLSPNDKWITKKKLFFISLSIPFILAFLLLVMFLRGDEKVSNVNILEAALDLIFQQSSILDVLGSVYNVNLPSDRFYSLGSLIDKYKDNFIFHLLGISESYESQTIEYAIKGHSLASYLTYRLQPARYLAGGGMGSCYIAEVWSDFGYAGVALWSFMYGFILCRVYSLIKRNVWVTSFVFIMIMEIIYSPRAAAINFIAEILSPTYLLTCLIMHYYARKTMK